MGTLPATMATYDSNSGDDSDDHTCLDCGVAGGGPNEDIPFP